MPERAENWHYELVKLLVAGNAAGLLAAVSAADKAHSYPMALVFVKICAVVFLIGLFCLLLVLVSLAATYSTLDRIKRQRLTEQEISEFETTIDERAVHATMLTYSGGATLLGGATVGIVGLLLY